MFRCRLSSCLLAGLLLGLFSDSLVGLVSGYSHACLQACFPSPSSIHSTLLPFWVGTASLDGIGGFLLVRSTAFISCFSWKINHTSSWLWFLNQYFWACWHPVFPPSVVEVLCCSDYCLRRSGVVKIILKTYTSLSWGREEEVGGLGYV